MGRGRVEIKRIEEAAKRQVTFSKRRGGLLKKAHELAVLCDARVGVVVFSSRGKLFEYCSHPYSLKELIHLHETTTNTRLQETNHDDQQLFSEMERLRHENDQLEASLRWYTGEDLPSLATVEDLDALLLQLESALSKIRERKNELLNMQLGDLYCQEHIFKDQESFLRSMINEDGQNHAAAAAPAVAAGEVMAPMLPPATTLTSSTALQLWPELHGVDGFGRRSQT